MYRNHMYHYYNYIIVVIDHYNNKYYVPIIIIISAVQIIIKYLHTIICNRIEYIDKIYLLLYL